MLCIRTNNTLCAQRYFIFYKDAILFQVWYKSCFLIKEFTHFLAQKIQNKLKILEVRREKIFCTKEERARSFDPYYPL